MKKVILILFFIASGICSAQTFTVPSNVVEKSANYSTLRLSSSDGEYTPVRFTNIGTNMSFTQYVRAEEGGWEAVGSFTVGNSFMWNYSKGKWNPDNSITIEQKLSIGMGYTLGLAETKAEGGVLVGSICVGGMATFSNVGAFLGVDILSERPMFGVAYNFAGLGLLNSATRFSKLP